MQSEHFLENIKHTRLKYGINDALVSVNLLTGRALAEIPGLSIGSGNFMISVNHIYNPTLSTSALTSFRGLWKFNIEQYLIRRLSTVREQEEYEFIDESGLSHIFKYLGHTGTVYRYYDTSGLNLFLTTTGSNNMITDSHVIQDDIGNQFIFDSSGRMTESISAINPQIRKKYVYNEGLLSEVFDERRNTRKITFHYHQNRISTIRVITNGVLRKSLHYDFDSNNNLRTITRQGRGRKGIVNEHKTHIFYKENSKIIEGFFDKRTSKLVKITYFPASEEIHRVSRIDTGIGTVIDIKKGIIRIGGSLDVPFLGEINSIELKTENIISQNSFTYTDNNTRTTVRNENNVDIQYQFNRLGNLASVFEVKDGLRELNKRSGVDMLNSGTGNFERINGVIAQIVSFSQVMSFSNQFSQNSAKIIQYRNEKFRRVKNFIVSFWLNLAETVMDNRILLSAISIGPNSTDNNYGHFDNQAINVWQYIEIDVRISGDRLTDLRMSFPGFSQNNLRMAAMKISHGPRTTFFLTDHRNRGRLQDINTIKHETVGNQPATTQITPDFYVTSNDIEETHKDFMRNNFNPEKRVPFILSLCDGTKKFLVNSCTFGFESFDINVNISATNHLGYVIVERSPNDEVITTTRFRRAMVTENNREIICLGISQTAVLEGKESTTDTIIDLLGRLRRVEDEYQAVTNYSYDLWGNMSQTISHSDVLDQISITFNDSEYQSTARTPRNEVRSISNEPLGEKSSDTFIDFVQLTGLEDQASTYQIDYESNVFGDRLETFSDNLNGKNNVIYNEVGRVIGIRPVSGSFYGYDYEYNELGDLTKCYFVSDKGRDLLTETIIERNQNTITRKGFRNLSTKESDEMIVSFDNYGNVSKISENGTITEFEKQVVVESESVAGIKSYFDDFEKRQQDFEYTEDDTEVEKYKNGDFLTVSSSGPDKVSYVLENFRNNSGTSETEISFDNSRYMNPRITSTNDLQVNQFNFRERVIYRYDGLGRIIEKDKPASNGNWTTERIKYHLGTFIPMEISEVAPMSLYETYSRIDVGRRVMESGLKSRYFDNGPTGSTFLYDRAGRLTREVLKGTIALPGGEHDYEYHPDGSLKSETRFGTKIDYFYNNGRLSNIGNDSSFDYDNLGNCIRIRGDNLTYTRFNLLESYTRGQIKTTYKYNSQGIRIKKENRNLNIDYYYDGAKLLGERDIISGNSFRYIYDVEEMIGFIAETHEGNHRHTETWYFIKDTLGSVVGLRRHRSGAVVFYEYNIWGESRVTGFDFLGGPIYKITHATHPNHIGLRNPIRWKSRYFDTESNLYYLEYRYYSPFMKMYITPCDPEEILYNINVVGFFNPYSIGSPVDFPKYDYNIFNSIPLSFDPVAIPRFNWRRFWIDIGILAGLYAFSAITKGTATPFLMKKKTAKKASIGLNIAKGTGKALAVRGAGDMAEIMLTRKNPYKTLEDALWGYSISATTGAAGKLFRTQLGQHVFGVVAQPLTTEFVLFISGQGFNIDNLLFNIIVRGLTVNFDNPVGQGSLRGVVRSVRKGTI